MDRPGALGAIGDTPVVRLSRLVEPGMAEVWVKLEAANPTGSYKDRMALAMIEGAERSGRLRPGQTVVEYTGGSTGSSLAFVCAVKGYPLRIVSSDAFADEKLAHDGGVRCGRRAHRQPRGHHPDADPARCARGPPRSPPRSAPTRPTSSTTPTWSTATGALGEELARAARRARSTRSCIYVGTAGCFLGATRALRERLPGDPPGGRRAGRVGGAVGRPARDPPHRGRRRRLRPAAARRSTTSTRSSPSRTADAFAMARRAAREEGVWSGPSTGANLTAALAVAAAARRRRSGSSRSRSTPGSSTSSGELYT